MSPARQASTPPSTWWGKHYFPSTQRATQQFSVASTPRKPGSQTGNIPNAVGWGLYRLNSRDQGTSRARGQSQCPQVNGPGGIGHHPICQESKTQGLLWGQVRGRPQLFPSRLAQAKGGDRAITPLPVPSCPPSQGSSFPSAPTSQRNPVNAPSAASAET